MKTSLDADITRVMIGRLELIHAEAAACLKRIRETKAPSSTWYRNGPRRTPTLEALPAEAQEGNLQALREEKIAIPDDYRLPEVGASGTRWCWMSSTGTRRRPDPVRRGLRSAGGAVANKAPR